MVKIRYLTKEGDTQKTMQLVEAQETVTQEIDNGNIVFDEDEKRIIERATPLRADGSYAVFPRIAGG